MRNGDVGRDISVRCQRCVGEKPRWRARGGLIVFPRILSPPHLAHLPNLNRLPVAAGAAAAEDKELTERRAACLPIQRDSPVAFGREKETSRLSKYRELRAQNAGRVIAQ